MRRPYSTIIRNGATPQLYFQSKLLENDIVVLRLEFNGCKKPESVWCYRKGALEPSEILRQMNRMVQRFFSKHGLHHPDAG